MGRADKKISPANSMVFFAFDSRLAVIVKEVAGLFGMAEERVVSDAVEAYCQRKLKLSARKAEPERESRLGDEERVRNVVNMYQRICVPALPPVAQADIKGSSKAGRKILAIHDGYDWERHFKAVMSDSWLIKRDFCTFGWIVGAGFEKVKARADRMENKYVKKDKEYGDGWGASF